MEEDNKLIAEFMKGETIKVKFAGAFYHNSWDWLMPVVEKIENLDRLAGTVLIRQECCTITSNMLGDATVMANESGNYREANTKLSNTYKAVVAFINWYNRVLE